MCRIYVKNEKLKISFFRKIVKTMGQSLLTDNEVDGGNKIHTINSHKIINSHNKIINSHKIIDEADFYLLSFDKFCNLSGINDITNIYIIHFRIIMAFIYDYGNINEENQNIYFTQYQYNKLINFNLKNRNIAIIKNIYFDLTKYVKCNKMSSIKNFINSFININ